MKRITSLLLALVMLLALAGCGNSANGGSSAVKSADLSAFLEDVTSKQEAAMETLPADALETLLVEVTNSDDVAKVEEIMNARISYQVGDGTSPGGAWYPETMDQWENNSRVVSVGNSVMLVVMDNADEIVTEFQNLFA